MEQNAGLRDGFRRRAGRHAVLAVFLAFIMTCGCGGKDATKPGPTPLPSTEAVPDFHLKDMNPNSVRYHSLVSPRDYLGTVSAWYFGHAG